MPPCRSAPTAITFLQFTPHADVAQDQRSKCVADCEPATEAGLALARHWQPHSREFADQLRSFIAVERTFHRPAVLHAVGAHTATIWSSKSAAGPLQRVPCRILSATS